MITQLSPAQHTRSLALAASLQTAFPNLANRQSPVYASAVDDAARPFAKRAVMGNLAPDREMLTRANPREGFLFFYNNYARIRKGAGRNTCFSFATCAFQSLFPTFQPAVARESSFYRQHDKIMAEWMSEMRENKLTALTAVKKGPKGFEVHVPLSFVSAVHSNWMLQRMIGRLVSGDELDQLAQLRETFRAFATGETPVNFYTTNALDNPFWSPNTSVNLRGLPSGRVYSLKHSGGVAVMLSALLTVPETEFLTQTPYAQVRPFDVFQLMMSWANTRHGAYGPRVSPPRTSKPLQFISATRPSEGTPRTNPEGIFVDENSDFWMVPVVHDTIGQFDGAAVRSYMRDDGYMSGVTSQGEFAKPPPSDLVFVDWLNLKLAYTNTAGNLSVKDLSRVRPATSTHYKVWLDKSVANFTGDFVAVLATAAYNLGVTDRPPTVARLINSVVALRHQQGEKEIIQDDVVTHDLVTAPYEGRDEFVALMRVVQDKLRAPGALGLLYDKVSVATVHKFLAELHIMLTEAPEFYSRILPEFRQDTKEYREQSMDPNYTGESIPYIDNGRFLQPHQHRCMNRLRGSPKFAILSVAAGGGKTVLALTDFLKELSKGNVKRGMIMCPAHLVAQYVKEVVDFVNGRLNVIAVTSYTLQTHGYEGMAQLIQSAPPNTFIVCDYLLAQGQTKTVNVGYGGARTPYQPVVDMLMSFNLDWVCCDESHLLKNGASNRSRAIAKLVATIPYKRLMSGTLMPDTVMDLVAQVRMMDPTVLGTEDDFVKKYAEGGVGNGKRTVWREGFADEILRDIKERVCWVDAHRKEWAALLPPLVETARDDLRLTPAQQACYNDLLAQTVKELENLPKNAKVKKLLGGPKKADGEGEGEVEEDEEDVDDITAEQLLRRSTAALEMFVSNPTSHALGDERLKGEDRISPKVGALARIMYEHIASGSPGKILIFCNYRQTAAHIYDNLPGDLRARTIHYVAEDKTAAVAQFTGDDNKIAMIGVEVSMNTGLNLQNASVLVRCDSVWTPGALEQGNSRILRPNVKNVETRQKVFIHWLIVNNTIDVLKNVYLFAKRTQVGLVENAGNPLFDGVELLAPPPLTIDEIAKSSNFDAVTLAPYYDAFSMYARAVDADYKEYRADHPEDIDPDTGGMRRMLLDVAPAVPNSKLMPRVPYVPGTELYAADQLGLQRYDVYMRLNQLQVEELESDDTAEDKSANGKKKALAENRAELEKIGGLAVHTEYGDGLITGVTQKELRVQLSNGQVVGVHKMACFFITRKQTNAHDMREAVLAETGIDYDKTAPKPKFVRKPRVTVPAQDIIVPPKPKKAIVQEDTRASVALQIVIVNDFVGLEMQNASKNKLGAMALQALGFTQPEPYVYAHIPTPQVMYSLFTKWAGANFAIEPDCQGACRDLYLAMKKMRKNAAHMVGLATAADLRNFYRLIHKPIKRKLKSGRTQIYPYPLVQDDQLYLCLPITNHPETSQAIAIKVPGVRWVRYDTKDTLQVFMANLKTFDRQWAKLLKRPDIIISNAADVEKQRKLLQRRAPALYESLR